MTLLPVPNGNQRDVPRVRLHQVEHLEIVADVAVGHEGDDAEAMVVGGLGGDALHGLGHHGAAVGLERVDVGAGALLGRRRDADGTLEEDVGAAPEVDDLKGVARVQVVDDPAHGLLGLVERRAGLRARAVDHEHQLLRRRGFGGGALGRQQDEREIAVARRRHDG